MLSPRRLDVSIHLSERGGFLVYISRRSLIGELIGWRSWFADMPSAETMADQMAKFMASEASMGAGQERLSMAVRISRDPEYRNRLRERYSDD